MPLGELAEIGPRRREPVEGCGRLRVVVTAGAPDASERVVAVRGDVDRVVRDRAERRLGRSLGGRKRPQRRTEHSRKDAVADGSLVRTTFRRPFRQERSHRAEGGCLVRIAPELLELLRVRLGRREHRLRREREDVVRKPEAVPRRERCVGHERPAAGGAVDERERFLLFRSDSLRKVGEEVPERHDLARAAVAPARDGRELLPVQHRRDSLGELRTDGGVAFEEVREPGEHDRADDPDRKRLAERGARARRTRRLRLALFGREPLGCVLAVAGGDAVDDELGVAVEELEKTSPNFVDSVERLG
jgi:hypothetical protein